MNQVKHRRGNRCLSRITSEFKIHHGFLNDVNSENISLLIERLVTLLNLFGSENPRKRRIVTTSK